MGVGNEAKIFRDAQVGNEYLTILVCLLNYLIVCVTRPASGLDLSFPSTDHQDFDNSRCVRV